MAELCFNTFNRSAYLGIEPMLFEQAEAAAAAGFRLFGPDVFSIDALVAAGGSVAQLANELSQRDVRCWEISALNIGERSDTLKSAEHLAEIASALRPEWILTNVTAPINESTCLLFAEACDILAGVGARPAIEYLPHTPACSIATASVLVDHVGTDRAKVLFDTWHHFRGPDTWAELEAAPLEFVAYVQFDDALPLSSSNVVEETLNHRTFPGEGEFDLTGYCDRLRAKGFDGVVSVEILSDRWRKAADLHEFARRAFDTSARFWP